MAHLFVICLFWIPVAVILYHWLGFPVLLWLAARLTRRRPTSSQTSEPRVSIVVAAHNEELTIEGKIRNCLGLDYPADRLEVVVGSDASDDDTDRILATLADPRLKCYRLDERRGKSGVLNFLAGKVSGDLVLITDADVSLERDVLRLMVPWFDDQTVGLVQAGYRRVNESGSVGEGFFDRWETTVKELEGRLGAMTTANGWAMMIRRQLFSPIPDDTIHDDLTFGLRVFRQGYRAVFERHAAATCRIEEEKVEFWRRVKMGRGLVQALARNLDLLSPRRGIKALAFFSHKVVRLLIPAMLPGMFVGLAFGISTPAYAVMLALLALSVLTAPLALTVGGRWRRLLLPQYYVLMNIALLVGGIQYLLGYDRGYWERTPRG